MQDLSISMIRYFVTLVDCKQFVKASETIHISQPALSKSIQILENTLGVQLLKRHPRGFNLTDEGQYFYEKSSYFLKLYDDYLYNISERVHDPYSGTVRISVSGAIQDAFFPDLISLFNQKYLGIKIVARDEDSEQTILSLAEGKVDFGIAVAPIPINTSEIYCVTPLLDSSYHLVFPEEHPFANKDYISIRDLDSERILLPGESSRIRQIFMNNCVTHDVSPKIVFSGSQIGVLLALVKRGNGFSVLPGIMLDKISTEGLTHRPISPTIPWSLVITYPKHGFFSLSAKCTHSYFVEYFKDFKS